MGSLSPPTNALMIIGRVITQTSVWAGFNNVKGSCGQRQLPQWWLQLVPLWPQTLRLSGQLYIPFTQPFYTLLPSIYTIQTTPLIVLGQAASYSNVFEVMIQQSTQSWLLWDLRIFFKQINLVEEHL